MSSSSPIEQRLYTRVRYLYPDQRVNSPSPEYVMEFFLDEAEGGKAGFSPDGSQADTLQAHARAAIVTITPGWRLREVLTVQRPPVRIELAPPLQ